MSFALWRRPLAAGARAASLVAREWEIDVSPTIAGDAPCPNTRHGARCAAMPTPSHLAHRFECATTGLPMRIAKDCISFCRDDRSTIEAAAYVEAFALMRAANGTDAPTTPVRHDAPKRQ